MGLTSKGVYIIGAKRTPFCKYGGSLRELPASHAFAATAKEAISSSNIDATDIDCTIVGNINFLSQCDGGKTPRYCGIYSGVPIEKPALGVNKSCGTGLQALITGAVDIMFGTSKICLTGGTELMSSLPLLVRNARFGTSLGSAYKFEDHIQKDLIDSYCGLTRSRIIETLAKKHNINKEEANQFALDSYAKWRLAKDANVFKDEITNLTVTLKKRDVEIKQDEVSLRNNDSNGNEATPLTKDINLDSEVICAEPADGAAALVLADEDIINVGGLQPLAKVVAWTTIGVASEDTGMGAIQAIRKLLEHVNMRVNDVDLFEINENFAAEVLIAVNELKIDPAKVNISGGALAVGNPVSATSARIATHLVHQLNRRNLHRGVAAASCGGGQGIAVMFQRV